MHRTSSVLKRILRGLLILIVVAVVGLYILFPVGMGVATVLPSRQPVGSMPANFESVALRTSDNIDLAGWYTPPTNGAVIILLHGAGESREATRGHAAMLARHGYGVLALDSRGHGANAGHTNRLGWEGTLDVGAAVEFLQGRKEVQRIGGLGLSMGGEVLLGAASQYPSLVAIVADGATSRSLDERLALPSERPLVHNFTSRVFYATARILSGDHPPKPLLESMFEARGTRFFFIAAGAKSLEVEFNQLFVETLGDRATLWVAPDVPHVGAFARYPDEYESRVIGFFDQSLWR